MNKDNLIDSISAQTQSQQRDASIRRLAAALMVSFRISEGYDLVCHLTRIPCRSNRDALAHWIRETAAPSEQLTNSALPMLAQMLRHKLNSIEWGD